MQDPDLHDPESTPNPYAPSPVPEEPNDYVASASRVDQPPTVDPLRIILRWSLVCVVSAAPSFVYGVLVTEGQIAGMLTGIAIFIAGYSLVDYGTATLPWRRDPRARRTLRITYGTRIAVSLLFPIGGTLDFFCGAVTISIIGADGGDPPLGFPEALLATLIQGCILNIVLALYALLVFLTQIVFTRLAGGSKTTQQDMTD